MRPTFKTTASLVVVLVVLIVELPLIALSGVTHVALIELVLSCAAAAITILCFTTIDKHGSNQTVFGMPLVLLGAISLIIQLIINIFAVLIGGDAEPIAYVLSIISILMGCALLLSTKTSLIHAVEVESTIQEQTAIVDAWQRILASLRIYCGAQQAENVIAIERQLRFTSPISSQKTREVDNQINRELAHLQTIVRNEEAQLQDDWPDCCERLSRLIALRNDIARS